MTRVYCLDCDERITLNPNVKIGMRFDCPYCDAELEVISLDPIEIDWVDEAWDDDDEYESDDEDDEEVEDDEDDEDEEDDW